jgi:hypothetical protein
VLDALVPAIVGLWTITACALEAAAYNKLGDRAAAESALRGRST